MFGSAVVNALATYDDGGGPALYLGGQFAGANGVSSTNMIRLSAAGFSPVVGDPNASVKTMTPYQGRLVAAGEFGASVESTRCASHPCIKACGPGWRREMEWSPRSEPWLCSTKARDRTCSRLSTSTHGAMRSRLRRRSCAGGKTAGPTRIRARGRREQRAGTGGPRRRLWSCAVPRRCVGRSADRNAGKASLALERRVVHGGRRNCERCDLVSREL